jgi:hypothetical protein
MKGLLYFGKDGKLYTLELNNTKKDRDKEYWLKNEHGEGTGLSEKDMFDMLDEYFKRMF